MNAKFKVDFLKKKTNIKIARIRNCNRVKIYYNYDEEEIRNEVFQED